MIFHILFLGTNICTNDMWASIVSDDPIFVLDISSFIHFSKKYMHIIFKTKFVGLRQNLVEPSYIFYFGHFARTLLYF